MFNRETIYLLLISVFGERCWPRMLEDAAKDKILVIKHGALGDIVQGLMPLQAFAPATPGLYFAYDQPRICHWLNDALV